METPRIGFIGQGFIGTAYADDFERRGYAVVRYSIEEPFVRNRDRIAECETVFIAVPTPTTPAGFDLSIVEAVIPLTHSGATVIIKSTMLPGSTEMLAKKFPDRSVMHSPEFLREKSAATDAAHPERNIVGIPMDTPEYRARAAAVLAMLPQAAYARVVPARAAELVKYAGNVFLYTKVLYANILFDLSTALDVSYEQVADMLAADPRIGASHLAVLHPSGHTHTPGRGAGGHCFLKDFEAFRRLYTERVGDMAGTALLSALEAKNRQLLVSSDKDIDLLEQIYGSLPQVA